MSTYVRRIKLSEVSLCAAGANPNAQVLLYKSATPAGVEMPFDIAKLPEEFRKSLEVEFARIAKENKDALDVLTAGHVEALAKAAPVVPPVKTQEEIEKSLPDSVRAELVKQRADTEILRKALDDERNLRLDREFTEVAKSLVPSTGVDIVKVAKILRTVDGIDKGMCKDLQDVLKAAQASADLVAKLTKEAGSASSKNDSADTAYGKLAKIAHGLVAAKICDTYADAFLKAVNDNDSLYAEHKTETEAK